MQARIPAGSIYILGRSHAEATVCGKYAVAEYPRLEGLLRAVNPRSPNAGLANKIVPYLVEVWLDDYARTGRNADIVETTVSGFSYLFDVIPGRLIAAWGISKGRHGGPRDKDRMRGHPLSAGELYHRGHAIPHTLGGPCDINLVPQLGKINIGPFRELERNAVATSGSLYFTYWTYARNDPAGQTPDWRRARPPHCRSYASNYNHSARQLKDLTHLGCGGADLAYVRINFFQAFDTRRKLRHCHNQSDHYQASPSWQ